MRSRLKQGANSWCPHVVASSSVGWSGKCPGCCCDAKERVSQHGLDMMYIQLHVPHVEELTRQGRSCMHRLITWQADDITPTAIE